MAELECAYLQPGGVDSLMEIAGLNSQHFMKVEVEEELLCSA